MSHGIFWSSRCLALDSWFFIHYVVLPSKLEYAVFSWKSCYMLWRVVLYKSGHIIIPTSTCSTRILVLSIKRRSLPPCLLPTGAVIGPTGRALWRQCRWLPRLDHRKNIISFFLSYFLLLSHMTLALGNQPPCCEEAWPWGGATGWYQRQQPASTAGQVSGQSFRNLQAQPSDPLTLPDAR